jgi:hypothetical protein
MIKTIHYSCGCILSFREGKHTGKVYYNITSPPELCSKHDLSEYYKK